MITRSEKLFLVLKELELISQINTINHTKTQKTIYILSRMGLDMGYLFKWYINSVYCSELSDDIFDIKEVGHMESYQLKTNPLAIIALFKMLFKDFRQDILMLRIISSILFMKENGNDKSYIDHLIKYNHDKTTE